MIKILSRSDIDNFGGFLICSVWYHETMDNGKERFKEELWAQTDPHATEELNKELNDMGRMQDVVQDSERQEVDNFMRETKEGDDRARASREQAISENALYGLVLGAIHDLTEKGGVKNSRLIGAFLEDLDERNEAAVISDQADPLSRFHGYPIRVTEFGAGIKGLIEQGVISPNMSFAKVNEVLDKNLWRIMEQWIVQASWNGGMPYVVSASNSWISADSFRALRGIL